MGHFFGPPCKGLKKYDLLTHSVCDKLTTLHCEIHFGKRWYGDDEWRYNDFWWWWNFDGNHFRVSQSVSWHKMCVIPIKVKLHNNLEKIENTEYKTQKKKCKIQNTKQKVQNTMCFSIILIKGELHNSSFQELWQSMKACKKEYCKSYNKNIVNHISNKIIGIF